MQYLTNGVNNWYIIKLHESMNISEQIESIHALLMIRGCIKNTLFVNCFKTPEMHRVDLTKLL